MKSVKNGLDSNWVNAYGMRTRANGRKLDPFLLLYVKHRLHTKRTPHCFPKYSPHVNIFIERQSLNFWRAFAFQKLLGRLKKKWLESLIFVTVSEVVKTHDHLRKSWKSKHICKISPIWGWPTFPASTLTPAPFTADSPVRLNYF